MSPMRAMQREILARRCYWLALSCIPDMNIKVSMLSIALFSVCVALVLAGLPDAALARPESPRPLTCNSPGSSLQSSDNGSVRTVDSVAHLLLQSRININSQHDLLPVSRCSPSGETYTAETYTARVR